MFRRMFRISGIGARPLLAGLVASFCCVVAAGNLAAQSTSWQLEWQSGAEWSYRRDQAGVVFNGRLWVLGGNDGINRNDVWSSADGITWTQETAAAEWSPRQDHAVAVFDNRLWVLGGNGGGNKNDVWSSADGVTWIEETAAAQWPTRQYHTAVAFDDGVRGERLWIMGGNGPGTAATNVLNDVWSSDDGITWTQETASALWPAREEHASAVFNGRLWVLGGSFSGSTSRVNDVWSSADGVTWIEETAAAQWSARRGHAAVVLNNRLWVLGGNGGGNRNDVWSSADGVNWTQDTAAAPWPTRQNFASAVHNNRLWVMGGNGPGAGTAHRLNDVWSSADGINWTQETAPAQWSRREAHATAVFNNRLWILGGNDGSQKNDVWSSADGVTWNLETAAALWPVRRYHAVAVFDNRLWVLGGNGPGTTSSSANRLNDVWSSTDGITWNLETASAGWSGRETLAAAVFNNKLWVLGGNDGQNKNDIWSSDDGVNWVEETAAALWPRRRYHTVAVYDNRLWVMGGNGPNTTSTAANRLNDVWSSMDGVNWHEETAAAQWSGRSGHASAVLGNRLWVMGGNAGGNQNDAWSSEDGVTWTSETAGWSARTDHTAAAFNNRLWVLGGYGGTPSSPRDDVWSRPDSSPYITSSPPLTVKVGDLYQYDVVAAGIPAPVISANGLPSWLSLNGDQISGTPGPSDLGQTGIITVTANNGFGVHDQNFQIDVQGIPPVFTSTPVIAAAVGMPYSYTVAASGVPAPSFSAGALPSWLSFNATTGELSGVPTLLDLGQQYQIEITADNNWLPNDVQNFMIDVRGAPPVFTGTPVTTATVGAPYSYIAAVTGVPTPQLSAGPLPGWLSFNAATGELLGTPAATDYGLMPQIEITASNGYAPDAVQVFVIDIEGIPPSFTSMPEESAVPGRVYSYTVTATGVPAPALSVVSTLPAWLSFNAGTGELSGVPISSAASTSVDVAIMANNLVGSDTQTFTIEVTRVPGAQVDSSKGNDGCVVSSGTTRLHTWLLLGLAALLLAVRRPRPRDTVS